MLNFILALKSWKFAININAKALPWSNAYQLLTPNISKKLKMFNLEQPISVNCKLQGQTGAGDSPLINVVAVVRNNTLRTPAGGLIRNCNFDGTFTNSEFKGRGINDANSLIKLYRFTGDYDEIPLKMDTVAISNLERPVASGLFQSDFDITRLNNLIGDDLLKFSNGKGCSKIGVQG